MDSNADDETGDENGGRDDDAADDNGDGGEDDALQYVADEDEDGMVDLEELAPIPISPLSVMLTTYSVMARCDACLNKIGVHLNPRTADRR